MSTVFQMTRRTDSRRRMVFLRKLFSFPVMLASLLAALAALTVRSRFDDPDLWWHLKTGQVIWTTHAIPNVDIFSYTTNHHAWIAHEWLSQVTIYGAYRLGGYSGLMLWFCLATIFLLLAGYLLCSVYSGNAKVAFLGALTIWFFATVGLAIRPQMLGYIFLVLELLFLQWGQARSPLWFFALPPLFALWVNCHGSFLLGLLLAALLLFCSFCNFRMGLLVSFAWDKRRRKLLASALALSLGALFLNPIGVKLILYPLRTLLHQPIGLRFVEEWMPLPMTSARGVGLFIVLGCVFLLLLVRQSELYFHEILLLIVGTGLAVSHRRMLFVFGILAAPILSRLLATSWEGYDSAHDLPLPNAVLIALSLLAIVWGFPTSSNLKQQVREKSPVQAVEYIETHHLPGPMLNDYTDGGYLIWAASDHPVFLDGRSDVFEWTGVLAEFQKWALLESDPNTLLNKYNIGFCLVANNSPIAHVLPLLPNWKAVYFDNSSTVFVRVPHREN